MTTVNNDELSNIISGFPPQASQLLANPTIRPIFLSTIIILKVYPVLILILGSFGNILSFCVLLRANMRRYSTFCYLACLALVDLGVIITFCINFIPLYHFNNDIQNGLFACKLFAFCIYFLPQYSAWILVAVSIDRVISAKYLRLAKTWSKPRHSVLVTLLLGLVLGILNSHFFLYENNSIKKQDQQQGITQTNGSSVDNYFSSDFIKTLGSLSNDGTLNSGSSLSYEPFTPPSIHQDTTLQQQYDNSITIQQEQIPPFDVNIIHCSLEYSNAHRSLHVYWTWIDLLMNVFLPFTAMIACTIIIILTLVRSSTRAGSTSARRSRRRRNISVMLITVNLGFISLTAPIVIFLSMYPDLMTQEPNYRKTILLLIKVFCIILMNLNHSVNIIIYSLTAKEFRTEMTQFLKAILHCIIGKPINPNDFRYTNNEQRIFSRLRHNFFKCCRIKMRSNSTNTIDSSGLQHTTIPGMNNRSSNNENFFQNKSNKHKKLSQNEKRKSSYMRYSETSVTNRNSHHLTVQLQIDPVSSLCEHEDLSLRGLSNSTED